MKSLFIKHFVQEKYKAAKLVLAQVSNAETLTQEVTDCNPWVPDARVMARIANASYNFNDYWRIVNVLHKRLYNLDWKKWRIAYNSLILLDFLLTHGPEEFADEFRCDRAIIHELSAFEYKDAKGFNWGVYMKNKSERVLKLLERGPSLDEARSKAINVTNKIQGFGSSLSLSSRRTWISSSFSWGSISTCLSSDIRNNYKYDSTLNSPTRSEEDLSNLLTHCEKYNDLFENDSTETVLYDLMGLGDDDEEEINSKLCLQIHVNHDRYSE